MAYARSITRQRSTRRTFRRAPAYSRRGRGGYNKRRRFTRRRPVRRRMSTRTVLNKTSQKKRDVMLSFTNTLASNPFNEEYFQGPAQIRFPVGFTQVPEFTYLWNATARPGENSSGQRGSKIDTSLRTSVTTFARGLKERVTLSTNDGTAWQWRRICFTSKDAFGDEDPDTADYFRRTSNGMVRLMRAEPSAQYWMDHLFDGERNIDWLSAMTAPVNSAEFTVKYDKLRTIRSGNEQGFTRTYQMWHPMNKNLVYSHEQTGETMTDSAVSVTGKAGMGNYYVADFFIKNGPASDTAQLNVTPESTFYWHEK
uniref:Capsid protein n=1 Tax=Genomoviridae sp. TaxID=2202565 RepID=A0A858NG61_9VIRU|nr:MAG: capsid protein [Genomoviridae sp.]